MRLLLLDGGRHEKLESGYGQLALGIKQELERRGVDVVLDETAQPDVGLYVCPPYGVADRSFDFPIAIFTMHEIEHLPEGKEGWPEKLDQTDLVLTPTTWNRAVWRNVGVKTRIEVVPLGINSTEFYPRYGRACRFLTVHSGLGSASSRENWHDTLEAFHRAFVARDDVELVIKTWSWREPGFLDAIAAIRDACGMQPAEAPKVTVVSDVLPGAEMRELYYSSWLFVKNANREGWGLPATEAVACDTRVAASAIQPLQSHLPPGTRWFTPNDVGELAFLLKDEKRAHAERLARAHRHTWQNTGAWVHRFLRELCSDTKTANHVGRAHV